MVWLEAIVVSAASVMMRLYPPHVIMTLSPVLTSSCIYKLHVITQHQGSYQVMEGAEWGIGYMATAQPSPQVAGPQPWDLRL